jgi:uncharacterized protein (DUF885 family)
MTDGPTSSSGSLRAVDALADAFVEEYAGLDPVSATALGIDGHEHELTDLSPDGFAARTDLVRRTLAAARDAEPVDERERAAQEAFVERLSVSLERAEAGVAESEVSVIVSELHEVRSVFDLMDTSTEEGWRAVADRLAAVPAALDAYRRTLTEAADRGHVSARRQYALVAEQVRGWTGESGGSPFFSRLVAPAPDALATELQRHADAATSAYAEAGRFLVDEMVPRGRGEDGVGRERYRLASRYFLGAEVDLEEAYRWGWDELARISADMAATADRIKPGATVAEAVAHLESDPSQTIEGTDAFRAWMQELADRTVEAMADTHFDIPEPVRRIECCIAPTQDGGIYYTGPSEDFSRPGRMWWSVPEGVTRFHPWQQVSTVYHEGVPGHHLQIGQTAYRAELLNRWQRRMCWVSGSGEGWALYAERLMDELGYLEDPADRLGMLDEQSFRAARVVVDIGVHLGLGIPRDNPFDFHPGETWDADLVWEFMRAHSRMDSATLTFEVNRYLGWPGQAPSYKLGERVWLQAREAAKARHGAAFDLKDFHRRALDLGSIGLDPLTRALGRL